MFSFDDLLGKDDKTQAEAILVQAVATLSTQGDFAAMTPDEVFTALVGYAFPAPAVLFFFDNGSTMAGDGLGGQMPRYQGRHADVLARLRDDGIDLGRVGEVYGSPEHPVKWVRPTAEGFRDDASTRPGGEAISEVFRVAGKAHQAKEFAVARARLAGVCRVCGEPIPRAGAPAGWEFEFGRRIFPPPALTLDFGDEFAHTACLPPGPEPGPRPGPGETATPDGGGADRTINERGGD